MLRIRSTIVTAVAVIAASVVTAPPAAAAAPDNDGFAAAVPLSGLPTYPPSVTTTGATKEPGEPAHAGNGGGASVWYSWTATVTGPVAIDTCNSEFDTLLAVYTGSSLTDLTPVVSDDDTCGTRSRLSLAATAGTTYRIAVDGYNGATGLVYLRIIDPLANDDFAEAEVLSGSLPITVTGTTIGATKENGEPDHGGNRGGSSVWYAWTATVTGPVVIDACVGSFWAQLGVYTGSAVNGLTSAVDGDERCGRFDDPSRLVRLAATAGTTYRIAVDGLNGATGDYQLRIQNAPANDRFADATVLSGSLPITTTGSNFGATSEPGEPYHAGIGGGHSVWYSWAATAGGPTTITACASSFDTVLGVYTGSAVDAMTTVAHNDDGCGTRSTVTFTATAGTTYRIAVDGTPHDDGSVSAGEVKLTIRIPNRPANDDLAAAQELTGSLPITVNGTNIDATAEPAEPTHAGNSGGASVWYSWTAGVTGQVTAGTCLSTFDTLLAVYTGSTPATLTEVASNDDTCGTGSTLRFAATAGTTYRIAVDGFNGATGTIRLKLVGTPVNDDLAAATVLTGPLPISGTGTNAGATAEPHEPRHGDGGGASVWYSWTAAASGPVVLSTCSSTFATRLGVYTGDAVGALVAVPVRDVHCTDRAKVAFTATAGTTYRIAVDGSAFSGGEAMTGAIGLTIRTPNPPANDDFANAEVLSGPLPITTTGTNIDATAEDGDPLGGASVWYSWTAEFTGPATISGCSGSGLDGRLGVYTGSAVGSLAEVPGEVGDCGGFGGIRHITAVAGTTYRIGISGQPPNDLGSFPLAISTPNRPPNDAFADAVELTGPLPLSTTGTNRDATAETGEPSGGRYSVWYRWTPGATGPVVIDTCDSGRTGDSALAVFTGSAVEALTEVAGNGDSCGSLSRVLFTATAGTAYSIRVSGELGLFRLTVKAPGMPPNDDFANAQTLPGSLPIATTGTNVDATREDGEPVHGTGGRGFASVWYGWTADSSGRVTIDTCESDFDTMLGVYTGTTVASLAPVARNNDGCGSAEAGSKVTFPATAGTRYRIAVDGYASFYGWPSAKGSVGLAIKAVPTPPPNDNRADARVLDPALPITVTASTVGATKESGEYNHVGNPGGASVWYRWTPAAAGPVTIDTCTTDFATLLAVYIVRPDGQLGGVGANRSGCGSGSRDTFTATPGAAYLIAVDGTDGGQGTFELGLRAASSPANDDFADAQALTGSLPISATGGNAEASEEPSEPNHAGTNGGTSVWYRWTAAATGRVTVDTCASDFDTVLGVYTGSAVNALTPVASDNNGCGTRSTVTFVAAAGTTYRIAVDGPVRNTGTIRLAIRMPSQPPNDDFAAAETLAGSLPAATTGTTVDATREASEPFHGGLIGTASVWYRWTAATTGRITVETCGSGFDTLLGVYSGDEVADLSTVAISDNACGSQSRVEFSALAGVTYRIAVDGRDGAAGPVRLTVRPPNRPANDNFAAPQQLTATLPIAVSGSNVDATRENGEPFHAGYSEGMSVWYAWTPVSSGRVTIDTCASGFNTVLGVYTGSAVAGLTTVAGDQDGCGRTNGGSKVAFTATAGTAYRIAVDGAGVGLSGGPSATGAVELRIAAADPPSNDDLADAAALTGSLPITTTGTNVNATNEAGEPFHAGFTGGASVWYHWTALWSGRVSIDTCGSAVDTLLGVYTGTAMSALIAVAANNNGCGTASKVTFTATAGTTYRIAVDRNGGADGSIALAVRDLEPPADSTTALTVAPSPSTYGQPVTLTATVASAGGRPLTGRVQFAVDGTDLGTPQPVGAGSRATITVSNLAAGSHSLTARYAGDPAHHPSAGSVSHTVDRVTTRLVAHPAVLDVQLLRITLRLSATLTDSAGRPVAGEPVRFVLDNRTVCTATTGTTGSATCSSTGAWLLAILRLGYDAHYDGDTTHLPARSHGGVLG